jgi:hypothetical protein
MLIMLLCVIRCLDVTLIIRYMLWNVYRMLAERHAIVPLWWLILCFQKKKKNWVVTRSLQEASDLIYVEELVGVSSGGAKVVNSYFHLYGCG